jgi:hypothetical protein
MSVVGPDVFTELIHQARYKIVINTLEEVCSGFFVSAAAWT